MSESTNALGAYLRARRELVTPQQAGIPDVGVRRVPGLRREEVAMLAGISADYYLRLERGRDRHPSVQVLESIARVLELDDDHFAHLLTLVADVPRQRRRRPRRQTPPSGALKLMDSLAQPAFIEDRYFDILAANRLATALSPGLAVGGNQLRDLFLDPAEQALSGRTSRSASSRTCGRSSGPTSTIPASSSSPASCRWRARDSGSSGPGTRYVGSAEPRSGSTTRRSAS
jgi:transcriptional regulator with XRE-family HTH domain